MNTNEKQHMQHSSSLTKGNTFEGLILSYRNEFEVILESMKILKKDLYL